MNDINERNYSRREFVRAAGAAGLALGATGVADPIRALALDKTTDPYGGFRMGVQSYSFRGFSFPDALTNTKKLGLKYIELFPGHVDHLKLNADQLAAEKKRMEDAGITPDSYGVVGFTKDEAAARKVFEFAKTLGLRSISADPMPNSFEVLDKLVAEFKIPIAIHNHGPGSRWEKPEAILAAVKDHHPLIGICCDSGHYLRSNIDPVQAIKVLKGRVFGFHIKDFVDEKTEVSAGDGRLKIGELLAEARAQKFDGPCSLEYELTPQDPMAGMARGLENFQKGVEGLRG